MQASRKTLRVLKDKTVVKDESIFKKFFQRIIKPSTEADQGPALCEWMEFGVKWIGNQANDVQRLLLLTPNNPEPLLAQFINQSLSNPVFNGEGFKQFTMAVLQTMHGIWHKYGEMGHLLVGTCMTNSDKTITNIAAEIWINGVINDSIDSKRIGQVIGRQQSIEFVPLKRFTDLAMQSLFRISPQHNRMLQVIIENMIAEPPGTAIKGLRKLLEILMELSSINKQPIEDERVKNKLELWKETEGLKKLVEGFQ